MMKMVSNFTIGKSSMCLLNFVLYFIASLTSVNPIALASLHNNTAIASAPGFMFDLLQVINYGMRTREKDSNEI